MKCCVTLMDAINITLFSLQLTDGPNKLECLSLTRLISIVLCSPLTYQVSDPYALLFSVSLGLLFAQHLLGFLSPLRTLPLHLYSSPFGRSGQPSAWLLSSLPSLALVGPSLSFLRKVLYCSSRCFRSQRRRRADERTFDASHDVFKTGCSKL